MSRIKRNNGKWRREQKALAASMRRHEVSGPPYRKHPAVVGAVPTEGRKRRQVAGTREQTIRVKAKQPPAEAEQEVA